LVQREAESAAINAGALARRGSYTREKCTIACSASCGRLRLGPSLRHLNPEPSSPSGRASVTVASAAARHVNRAGRLRLHGVFGAGGTTVQVTGRAARQVHFGLSRGREASPKVKAVIGISFAPGWAGVTAAEPTGSGKRQPSADRRICGARGEVTTPCKPTRSTA
jgi:hypothetical protein